MKFAKHGRLLKSTAILFSAFILSVNTEAQIIQQAHIPVITSVQKTGQTTVELTLDNHKTMLVDFYGDNIFRVFIDTTGIQPHAPQAKPEAQILVDDPRKPVNNLTETNDANAVTISTAKVKLIINKKSGTIKAINLATGKTAFETTTPLTVANGKSSFSLKEGADEYFFGGGVQNGRFSHKGKIISIENLSSWTDGGVASPDPFYWSTNGYAVMWYTFKPGKYDFGATQKGTVKLFHNEGYFDVFFMVDDGAAALLNDYYQLTGHPVLLPKFGFYEGHLNAYNRDYWKRDTTGRSILFEDGKRYTESQKDNGGIKESLNGEKNNYQFSARAVIDRYNKNDMPLGWVLPNDGYGAGYGQASTLDSNILNLKNFGDYARKHGVQIGLWTQSDLHPKAGVEVKLQRDLDKEVGVAGVRVLKTDVAWVGPGYSFGLHGIADAAAIIKEHGNNARPFIITLDGWAGTQRYAGVWTGDQTGGEWEYIRFHIPTYIGSGLSGQPNITSDMDGIFGGNNPIVNTRDFQWKTFTPMQLNMDGWGATPKYPFILGEPAASINRNYLKWKSELIPYTYSIAKQATDGLPVIRAMFLDKANTYTLGASTEYQYMYGPYFLVAPVYQNTAADSLGNDIRNNIYLPDGTWIDYFTGEAYQGNIILNNFKTPIWKLPVFVKDGAIIPLANPNNNVSEINKKLRIYEVYPHGKTSFTQYDDDGLTLEYKDGKGATTLIQSETKPGIAIISIAPAKGSFNGFEKNKATEIRVDATSKPKKITAAINGKIMVLQAVNNKADFDKKENVYYYDAAPELNQFPTPGSAFAKVSIIKNPMIYIRLATTDITATSMKVTIDGFSFVAANKLKQKTGVLTAPAHAAVKDNDRTAFTLQPSWKPVSNADYYEISFNNMLYSTIRDTAFLFDGLTPETNYNFKLRSVNKSGHSDWITISGTTKNNPLQYAIKDISIRASVRSQGGSGIRNLVNFDESDLWHSRWDTAAVPFNIVMDLNSISQLDKLEYLPRDNAGNGTFLKGAIQYSDDKQNWTDAGSFDWARSAAAKTFAFNGKPVARYVRINVTGAVGNFGSGREIYVFKVPGSESYIPGDINNDKIIDQNDLTSYMNYTGLQKGDADFDGYINKGDLNKNGLIDAYDISAVATQLDGGAWEESRDKLAGTISLSADKQKYSKGETVTITVKGNGLKVVNALSFTLPYNADDYEYISTEPVGTKQMDNLTYNRLHSNGQRALYPTFVNVGDKETLNGSDTLFVIKFKAKRDLTFNLKAIDGILVDKRMEELKF